MSDHVPTGRRGRLIAAGVLFGIGLGGLFDGIVFHQILQWHHMVSTPAPPTTLENLQLNTLGDGVFHAATWLVLVLAIFTLTSSGDARGATGDRRTLVGAGLVGWGAFNLVEGAVTTTCSRCTTSAPDPTSWRTTSRSWRGAP